MTGMAKLLGDGDLRNGIEGAGGGWFLVGAGVDGGYLWVAKDPAGEISVSPDPYDQGLPRPWTCGRVDLGVAMERFASPGGEGMGSLNGGICVRGWL